MDDNQITKAIDPIGNIEVHTESETPMESETTTVSENKKAEEKIGTTKSSKKKLLSRWINPVKIFRNNMTSENIDDETATTMVNIIGIVGGLAFIAVVGLATMIIYGQFSSYSSQMKKAEEYVNLGDFSKAAVCYERAIDSANSKEDKVESRLALANLYLEQESETNAAYYLEQVVGIDKNNEEAIKQLLTIYEEDGDLQAILDLAKKVNSERTETLFADYLLSQPVFNYKSGTYDENITVEITAGEADLIYYTTDGTEATEMSKLYTEPIRLSEGHTEFHAMAVNANGLLSENVVVNYEIIAEAPEKPVISPNSGLYTELTTIQVEIPDNCDAYYTLDGTVPTADSLQFTGELSLPLGNHIFSIVFINHNGVASEVATKVYDFVYKAPVTKVEALTIVKEGLVASGELVDVTGQSTNAAYGFADFSCNEIITINDTQYYRVDKIYTAAGPFGSYAVEINTGAVFSLQDNNGKYTLVGFQFL